LGDYSNARGFMKTEGGRSNLTRGGRGKGFSKLTPPRKGGGQKKSRKMEEKKAMEWTEWKRV